MQLDSTKTVDPFGEVNVFGEADGSIRVKATILMRPQVEGAQTGLAIDGSNSMNQISRISIVMEIQLLFTGHVALVAETFKNWVI